MDNSTASSDVTAILTARAEVVIRRYVDKAAHATDAAAYWKALHEAAAVFEFWADLVALPGDASARTVDQVTDAARLNSIYAHVNVPANYLGS